jgi:hypothetical protein
MEQICKKTPMRKWLWLLAVPVFWYGMMAAHELGHVVSTVVNGGTIDAVNLVPWAISQTMRHGSSAPIVDIWAGALVGSVLPVFLWVTTLRLAHIRLCLGLFAGFCCLANGIYFGLGWLDEAGDTGELLALDFPVWPMVVFGVLAIAAGLAIWHSEIERARAT